MFKIFIFLDKNETKNQDCPKTLENVICFFLAAHTKPLMKEQKRSR
jgi:hypothetical protein